MADRPVTQTLKNSDGDITALCDPDESWSPRAVSEVIADIESGAHTYFVPSDLGDATIQVVDGPAGKYVRSYRDQGIFNNLDELPVGAGEIPVASWADIVRFAPLVQLHSSEKYFPMDPVEFLRSSRFRHHDSPGYDHGYSKTEQDWEKNDDHRPEYYDIPVALVDSYRVDSNGKNRRPRDDNSGDDFNVFLQPRGKPRGDHAPTGRIPVFVHAKQDTCASSKSADYVVQYWWFFGYNDGAGNHQGDWEHATTVVKNGILIGAYLAAHGHASFYERSKLEPGQGDRFVAYVSKGSHAAYPSAGAHSVAPFVVDQTDGGGYLWDTSQNLLPMRHRPWKNFAGAWGEVGSIASTTGPLGPWHKRHNC